MKFTTCVAVVGIMLAGLYHIEVGGNELTNGSTTEPSEMNFYTIVKKLNALTKEVETLKDQAASNVKQQVAFMARRTTTITGNGHFIVYNDISLNIGNAYSPIHGNFVAPMNGTYQFSLYACSNGGKYIFLILFVNQEQQGSISAGDNSVVSCTSEVFMTNLTAGDDVYVKQHASSGDYLYASTTYGLPSFAGVLLYTY